MVGVVTVAELPIEGSWTMWPEGYWTLFASISAGVEAKDEKAAREWTSKLMTQRMTSCASRSKPSRIESNFSVASRPLTSLSQPTCGTALMSYSKIEYSFER
jgi:hypothetical protein